VRVCSTVIALAFSVTRPLFCLLFVALQYLCVLGVQSLNSDQDRLKWRSCIGHRLHEFGGRHLTTFKVISG